MNRLFSLSAALLFCTLGLTLPVRAQQPEQYHMAAVQMLATRADTASTNLLREAQVLYRHVSDPEAGQALAVLRDLSQAATRYNNAAETFRDSPSHTEDAWRSLAEAYRRAGPVLASIRDRSVDAQNLVGILQDSMSVLAGYYAEPPTAAGADWKLRQNAGEIVRRASALAAHAHDLALRGVAGRGEADRFERLSEAAGNFYGAVRQSEYDSRALEESYVDLVRRLQDVRVVVGDFNLNVQRELGVIWNLAQQFNNVLAPQVRLGDFQIYEFHREE